ncbi:unnamed protein product, partial [Meganyctiphanes norvegica]
MVTFWGENELRVVIVLPPSELNVELLWIIVATIGSYLAEPQIKTKHNDLAELVQLSAEQSAGHDCLVARARELASMPPMFIQCTTFVSISKILVYIQTIMNFMHHALPRELAEFLDFHHYELTFLLQTLAMKYFMEGDELLMTGKPVTFSPLELHAMSYRMKNPLPTNVASQQESDFSHVVDFASQVKKLVIEGSDQPFRESNVIQNNLDFTLNAFKSAEIIVIKNGNVKKIGHLGGLRKSLEELYVHESGMTQMADMILCDAVHKETLEGNEMQVWPKLKNINVSGNQITKIDISISLSPNIQTLNLSRNNLSVLENLIHLPHLVSLDLSNNQFTTLEDMHTKLGNVVHLDLSQNDISSLQGLSKLYSLSSLKIATNNICKISEVSHIASLPCLETLNLTGNPVTTVVDYRTKVLELFGRRASEVCLDNERPTQRELDTVAVLQAIRASREGCLPTLSISSPLPQLSSTLLQSTTTSITFIRPDKATVAKENSNCS